jgi:myo-inositol 2-dehydrogenase / D-chiro-inositol 1-dehydrogenase
MSSKQDIRMPIAVAGLGRMGKRHVLTLLNRVALAQVVAVCSTEPRELEWARNEYKDWGIKVYDDYASMIEHPGLQAVWVSTSTDVHASQTVSAIGKGLNVLCEKPLSTDIEEVRGSLYTFKSCSTGLKAYFTTSTYRLSVSLN